MWALVGMTTIGVGGVECSVEWWIFKTNRSETTSYQTTGHTLTFLARGQVVPDYKRSVITSNLKSSGAVRCGEVARQRPTSLSREFPWDALGSVLQRPTLGCL